MRPEVGTDAFHCAVSNGMEWLNALDPGDKLWGAHRGNLAIPVKRLCLGKRQIRSELAATGLYATAFVICMMQKWDTVLAHTSLQSALCIPGSIAPTRLIRHGDPRNPVSAEWHASILW